MRVYFKKDSGRKGYIKVVTIHLQVNYGDTGMLISEEMLNSKGFDKNKFIVEEFIESSQIMIENKVIPELEWIRDPYEIACEKGQKNGSQRK